MKLEEIQDYKSGFVFRHTITNKVFSKFSVKTLIRNYEKRVSNPYTSSRVTRQIEKVYLGDVIRKEKNDFFDTTNDRVKIFTEKLTEFLVPIPRIVLRTDEQGNEKSHNSSCEYASDDCKCWCKGKYHGIGL